MGEEDHDCRPHGRNRRHRQLCGRKGFPALSADRRPGSVDAVRGRVQFADGTAGVIAPENREEYRKDPQLAKLYIDVGAASREEAQARLGQAAGFVRPFADLGRRVVAKAFDDRIGCIILIELLRRLGTVAHDVHAVFSVQEEVGLRGAQTSAYGLEPDVAIALDITAAADTPKLRRWL